MSEAVTTAAIEVANKVMLPDIISSDALAVHLGIERNDVECLLNAGKMPGRRIGAKWFIPRIALMEWLRGDVYGY